MQQNDDSLADGGQVPGAVPVRAEPGDVLVHATSVLHGRWAMGPTAAIPVDNPCCSCKLTKSRRQRVESVGQAAPDHLLPLRQVSALLAQPQKTHPRQATAGSAPSTESSTASLGPRGAGGAFSLKR